MGYSHHRIAADPIHVVSVGIPMTKDALNNLLVYSLLAVATTALPGGLIAAWYFDNGNFALISIAAFIFFMAG